MAAISPALPVSVRTVAPWASSSAMLRPEAEGRAYTPLADGPLSSFRAPGSPLTCDHVPTSSRSVSGSSPAGPSSATAEVTPAARRWAVTVRHVVPAGDAHSTRTGSRLPSTPVRNGCGKEPTTAGTSSV